MVPLFRGGEVLSVKQYNAPIDPVDIVNLTLDEHGTLAVAVSRTGKVDIWHAGTGTLLKSLYFDFGAKKLTSVGKTIDNNSIAFGFSDGTLRLAEIVFRNDIIPEDTAPQGLRELDDQDKTDGDTIFSKIPGKGLRKVDVELDLKPEIRVSESGFPIVALGYRLVDFGDRPKSYLAVADSSGEAHFITTETRSNMLTGVKNTEVNKVALPIPSEKVEFKFAVINDMGDEIMLADKQGRVFRYDVRNESEPKLAEVLDLLPSERELTVFDTLLGGRSIVVGDSLGGLSIYFLLRRDDAQSTDGVTMVRAREFAPLNSGVAGFSASQNGKSFATLDSNGSIWLIHGISQKILLKLGGTTIFARKIALSPRLESLVAIGSDGQVGFWKLSIPHPEISWRTLFGKVWYEGYPSPSFTWQSTGATDAFEPKLSLVPLIFGTMKATFYSLLFAAPLALLAAIYTSEFVPKNVHGKIKPIMEIMASLPSVVLGFVAALVLAPVVESWIGAVILAFVVLPMSLVASAYIWQLIPVQITLKLEGLPKLMLMGLSVFLGLSAAYFLGPEFEKLFFNGDLKTWLNTNQGSSRPLLFLLTLPVAGAALTYAISRTIGPRLNVEAKIIQRSLRAAFGHASLAGGRPGYNSYLLFEFFLAVLAGIGSQGINLRNLYPAQHPGSRFCNGVCRNTDYLYVGRGCSGSGSRPTEVSESRLRSNQLADRHVGCPAYGDKRGILGRNDRNGTSRRRDNDCGYGDG